MDYSRPELADRLAADYAAGTLRGGARRRFERLVLAHPALHDAVVAWQARLMPLTAVVEPQTPSPAVWRRIEAALGHAAQAPARWWSRLGLWQGLAATASAAALALAVLVALPDPARPPVVVVLSAAGATPGAGGIVPASFVASISGDGRAMVTRPLTPVAMQADRALELWSLPKAGAPRSLGLISGDAATVLQRGKVPADTAALAVSLEPTGGSPTGAPTGPVLFVGQL